MELIAEQIKKRRKVLRVTQKKLAELSGVGLRTLKALEQGESNATLQTLYKIADVLGIELKLAVKTTNSYEKS